MSVIAIRLKEARSLAGISQEKLGVEAGLDEMSASTRMNRYELGKRVPNPTLVERFAEVLDVPATYFYAVSEDEAHFLLTFHRLDRHAKLQVIEFIEKIK